MLEVEVSVLEDAIKCYMCVCQVRSALNCSAESSYDVSLMIEPPELTPVTLLLDGSNVGRGDKWYYNTAHDINVASRLAKNI